MRSENVFCALKYGRSRYEICQVVSKDVRRLHKPGASFQESIAYALAHIPVPAEGLDAIPGKSAATLAADWATSGTSVEVSFGHNTCALRRIPKQFSECITGNSEVLGVAAFGVTRRDEGPSKLSLAVIS